MKKYTLLIAFLSLNHFVLFAQEEVDYNKWSAQLNVQHQDLGFDFQFGQLGVYDNVLIRPVISLDMERAFLRKGNAKKKILLTSQIGFYSNTYHERWLSFKVGVRRERQLFNHFYLSFGIEAGLTRTKNSDIQYVLENDKWVPTSNFEPARLDYLFGPRMDIGYRVIKGVHPIDIFTTNNLLIHANSFGGFPYYATGIGVRYGL